MMPQIIAICGLKRSGKDTIADYLCKHHNYEKIKIASPLKEGLKAMFGFTDKQLEENEKDIIDPRWGIEPRKVMQFFGTEVMQYHLQTILPDIGRSFWIKLLIEQHILDPNNADKRFVIPDLRFKHEYDMLAIHGTHFWRVERPTDTQQSLCSHVSEKEFLNIPVSKVFHNEEREALYNVVNLCVSKMNIQ